MPSNNTFTSLHPQKQAEIIQRMMLRFRSSRHAYGWADPKRRVFNGDKKKWEFEDGALKTLRGQAGEEQWRAHLSGEMLLGLGPTLDDGTCYWACIDVDHVGEFVHYDFDVIEIIGRVKRSFPFLYPVKSKSGGLHLFHFYNTPQNAKLVRDALTSWSAQIGVANNEIFPKQVMLKWEEGDVSSWVFMPYFGGRL